MRKTGIAAIITAALLLCGCGEVGAGSSSDNSIKNDGVSSTSAETAGEEAAQAEGEYSETAEDSAVAGAFSAGEGADSEYDSSENGDQAAGSGEQSGDEAGKEADGQQQSGEDENASYDDSDDPYVGTFYENTSERCTMTISSEGGNAYSVYVQWGDSAYSSYVWTFSGEFNGRAVMYYENCVKAYVSYDEDGNETRNPVFSHGTGYIQMNDFGLTWADDHEGEQYSFSRA